MIALLGTHFIRTNTNLLPPVQVFSDVYRIMWLSTFILVIKKKFQDINPLFTIGLGSSGSILQNINFYKICAS